MSSKKKRPDVGSIGPKKMSPTGEMDRKNDSTPDTTLSTRRRFKKIPKEYLGSYTIIPDWLDRNPDLDSTTKRVYARLARYLGGGINPSHSRLAENLGLSRRTILRSIKHLINTGWIEQEQRPGNKPVFHLIEHPSMFSERVVAVHPTCDKLSQPQGQTCDKLSHLPVTGCHNPCDKLSHPHRDIQEIQNIETTTNRTLSSGEGFAEGSDLSTEQEVQLNRYVEDQIKKGKVMSPAAYRIALLKTAKANKDNPEWWQGLRCSPPKGMSPCSPRGSFEYVGGFYDDAKAAGLV